MPFKQLFLLAIATISQAATPQGFEPASETGLLVSFGTVAVNDGNVLQRNATQTAPSIGTDSKLEGTSFAVLMIDLDIPTDNPPETGTLLHWLQTGLTQSESSTTINTTTGTAAAFLFQVDGSQTALAEYIGPNPPARLPLSHRYTEILVDTSAATEEDLAALESAAASRLGFDTLAVLTEAGLADKVLAGNFFNVTNPGPVTDSASNSSTGTGPTPSFTSAPTETPVQSPIQPALAVAQRASGLLIGLGLLGAVFLVL